MRSDGIIRWEKNNRHNKDVEGKWEWKKKRLGTNTKKM